MRRREWHRRVAEALTASSRPDPDVVAHHFQQANDDRAVDWLIQAGERAALFYASKTAIERLEAALPALEAIGDDRRRGWILWLLGEQFGFIDSARGFAYYDEAESIGSMVGDNLLVAFARMYRGFDDKSPLGLRAGLPDVSSGVDLLDQIIGDQVEQPPIQVPDWSHPKTYHAFRALMRAIAGDLEPALADIPEYVSSAMDQDETSEWTTVEDGNCGDSTHVICIANARSAGSVRCKDKRPKQAQAFEKCTALMARTNDDAKHAIMYMNWLVYLVLPYFADDLDLRRTLLKRHDHAWEQAAEKFGAGPMPAGASHLRTAYLDGAWSEMDWMERLVARANGDVCRTWGFEEELVFGRRAHACGDFERAWREIRRVLSHGPATEPGDIVFRGAEELQRVAIELALDSGDMAEARALA